MFTIRRADLHSHTYYSDGELSPSELVRQARIAGLSLLAITDHDCVDGLAEGMVAGRKWGVEVISGVELSVSVGKDRVHLLGYFFDPENVALKKHLASYKAARRERGRQIVERLNNLGKTLSIDFENYTSLARPHIAEAMVKAGLVHTRDEAFMRYIGYNKPAYIATPSFPASEALDLLHAAGGIGVLAHPGNNTSSDTISLLVYAGLDGIETVHPSHDEVLSDYYRRLTRSLGLIETGGSDYHGQHSRNGMGSWTIPHAWVEKARARANQLAAAG